MSPQRRIRNFAGLTCSVAGHGSLPDGLKLFRQLMLRVCQPPLQPKSQNEFSSGLRLCENSDFRLACRTSFSIFVDKTVWAGGCLDLSVGCQDWTTSSHSITLSASASNEGGTMTPSVLAALRLTMNVNLAGCSMGRLPGLAPLRILST